MVGSPCTGDGAWRSLCPGPLFPAQSRVKRGLESGRACTPGWLALRQRPQPWCYCLTLRVWPCVYNRGGLLPRSIPGPSLIAAVAGSFLPTIAQYPAGCRRHRDRCGQWHVPLRVRRARPPAVHVPHGGGHGGGLGGRSGVEGRRGSCQTWCQDQDLRRQRRRSDPSWLRVREHLPCALQNSNSSPKASLRIPGNPFHFFSRNSIDIQGCGIPKE